MTTRKPAEMMAKEQSNYLSYLLRLWRVNEEGNLHRGAEQAVWRASLENPHTRQRQGFASLDELCDFLREQIRMASEPPTSGAEQNPASFQASEIEPLH